MSAISQSPIRAMHPSQNRKSTQTHSLVRMHGWYWASGAMANKLVLLQRAKCGCSCPQPTFRLRHSKIFRRTACAIVTACGVRLLLPPAHVSAPALQNIPPHGMCPSYSVRASLLKKHRPYSSMANRGPSPRQCRCPTQGGGHYLAGAYLAGATTPPLVMAVALSGWGGAQTGGHRLQCQTLPLEVLVRDYTAWGMGGDLRWRVKGWSRILAAL